MLIQKREILLIGIGNEFQHDDAIGLEIVRALKKKNLPNVKIKEETGDGTALVDAWKGRDTVFLFDAIQTGKKPGFVHRADMNSQSPLPKTFKLSTHGFSIFEAIELSKALNYIPNTFILYGIEGGNFETGVGLSPFVAQALPIVIEKSEKEIIEQIQNHE